MRFVAQLHSDWRVTCRGPEALAGLSKLAEKDEVIARLIAGPCPTPTDLIPWMRQPHGDEAAAVIRAFLKHADATAFAPRFIVQALVPGLFNVAERLRWGRGGPWDDGDAFGGDMVATLWQVVTDWAGHDRPYAALDLLSATRCRLRRQLFAERDRRRALDELEGNMAATTDRSETDLDELARYLVDLAGRGVPLEEVRILYSRHVLGVPIGQLAIATGLDRRRVAELEDLGRLELQEVVA